jgi:AraC-like DNA-binding protein/mannose-6-phosphate isomerase-like protein (cupin superfamily)
MKSSNSSKTAVATAVTETLKIDALSRNLKMHFHEEYSVTVIFKGRCRAQVEGKNYPLKAGDVFIVSPGIAHACIPARVGTALSYTATSFNPEQVETFFMDSRVYRIFTSHRYMIMCGIPGIEKFFLHDKLLFEYFLSEILHHVSEMISPAPLEEERIAHSGPDIAADYLRENYMKNISLDELAEISGLSKYYLIHRFRKKYGITPYSYMTNLRINSAKKLLKENTPLCHIALELGFYDQSHFTNTFIQYTGLSPQAFRNFLL